MFRFSEYGKSILKARESLRLKAYLDGGGVPTDGWGHTKGVKLGDVITLEQAEEFLAQDLYDFELAINRLVYVDINQNQYDALVCLVFNIGINAFQNSTLRRKLNTGDVYGAADQFDAWVFDNGKRVHGLELRRKIEKTLFLKGMDNYGKTIVSESW
jgi:lysozyme